MLQHIAQGYQTKKNEMSGTCGTYRGQERCIQGFGGMEVLRKRDHLEDLGWMEG